MSLSVSVGLAAAIGGPIYSQRTWFVSFLSRIHSEFKQAIDCLNHCIVSPNLFGGLGGTPQVFKHDSIKNAVALIRFVTLHHLQNLLLRCLFFTRAMILTGYLKAHVAYWEAGHLVTVSSATSDHNLTLDRCMLC